MTDSFFFNLDNLPLEMYDSIIGSLQETFRALLTVRKFALSLTINRRMDFILLFGHSIEIEKDRITWKLNDENHTLWDDIPSIFYSEFAITYKWYYKSKLYRNSHSPSQIAFDKYGRKLHEIWTDSNGEFHRENDKPSLIERGFFDGSLQESYIEKKYHYHGINHREEDKPAIVEKFYHDETGTLESYRKRWVNQGILHRAPKEGGFHEPAYISEQFYPFDNGMTIILPHSVRMWYIDQEKIKKEYKNENTHIVTHYEKDYIHKIWYDPLGNMVKEKKKILEELEIF